MPNYSSSTRRLGLASLCATALLVLPGCGSGGLNENSTQLQGTVTVGGSSLPEGTTGSISFRPEGSDSKPVTVQIIDGQYDSPQTPKGKVTAYFIIQSPTGKTQFSDRVGKEIPIMEDIVPSDHRNGIELQVNEDNSTKDFDL